MTARSMKFRATTLAVLFAFCTMMITATGAMAAPAASTPATPHLPAAYVQGTDALGNALSAVFTVQSFANQGNQLVAQGVLNGTITSATGTVTPVTNQAATLPVSGITSTCYILSLTLGPLHLNLLGLDITLNQVVLHITAIPGPGNLLGNLLCDVANLLNGTNFTGLLNQLVADLNLILSKL